ncbi:MAG: hypothetical protein P1V36_04330 [Planctomycetota bacterium]|nr:hypothetical protein [Planctomycetota bacterium]
MPSRESAAFTLADDKGRVSFVHVRGERGPLLVRERRTDGSVHWHTLAMDTEDVRVGPLRIALRKNGTAHVHGKVIPPPTDTPFVHGPQTWPALRTLLALVAGMAGFERKPDGASTLTVVVWAERGTPWKFVARVLMVCAAPDVRVASLRLELDQEAGAVPYELPRDRGLLPVDPSATKMAKLKLLLRRQDGTQTSWRLSDRRAQGSRQDVSADGPSLARAWTELTNRMGKAASRAATAKQPFVFEIVAWSDVPYADVRRAIAVALTLGIDDIRLSSSPR